MSVIAKIYARDHYQCRYCGERLVLTAVMRLVSRLYPEQFPTIRTGKRTPLTRHSFHDQQRSIISSPLLVEATRSHLTIL